MNVKASVGTTELIHGALDQDPGDGDNGTWDNGGKGREVWGFLPRAWELCPFLPHSLPLVLPSLLGAVDRTMPASVVISSLAGLLREKVYSRNFVVTGGKMEKEVKRAGEGDWEVPRKCHFQFSVSLGPGWPEVRWRLFLPLLSASHANAHFLRQKQIYTHIRVK